ncbi:conserved hypothetical protein [Parvibaculum lavamentivorans DS-1]|uniref:Predicted pPIWI-associating nuclease group 2 domain-containing protein n=1 Tax=Parvibaculum lavamentivorans (strain DS-1 / DSM 13023 / NCIMB 13966) TaxID=402881 RepID=A7HPX1_PARL1|nr:hypothetical protein [Parvibaculum lavamentivorans]ABS61954.1 conserved hypothetical protein [Parvibaculum lavamentivorans DS-1]
MSEIDEEKAQDLKERIVRILRATDVSTTDAWQDLSVLSFNTVVDSLETFEDEIFVTDKHFFGPILWHVTLNYDDDDGGITISESFPGKFEGELSDDGGTITVSQVTADTSSFYK